MARLKRRHSKKIALLGMGLGLLGVVCLSTIGFANFNFGKEQNFTADGNFVVLSDTEYIHIKQPTITHNINATYEGFYTLNDSTYTYSRTAQITASFDVEYIYKNSLDDSDDNGRNLEFLFTLKQIDENEDIDISNYTSVKMMDYLDSIHLEVFDADNTKTFNKIFDNDTNGELVRNDAMSSYGLSNMDDMRLIGDGISLDKARFNVIYNFSVADTIDFGEIFFKMYEQQLYLQPGVLIYG